jgi:hypothetical protein
MMALIKDYNPVAYTDQLVDLRGNHYYGTPIFYKLTHDFMDFRLTSYIYTPSRFVKYEDFGV